MPKYCCADWCTNSSATGYKMCKIPANPSRRKIWTEAINRENWTPSQHSVLCEVHFAPDAWEKLREDGKKKLKLSAIPTIFRRNVMKVQQTNSEKERNKNGQQDPGNDIILPTVSPFHTKSKEVVDEPDITPNPVAESEVQHRVTEASSSDEKDLLAEENHIRALRKKSRVYNRTYVLAEEVRDIKEFGQKSEKLRAKMSVRHARSIKKYKLKIRDLKDKIKQLEEEVVRLRNLKENVK